MINVGRRDELISRRQNKLMSQIKMAARLGISQTQYYKIENGYANPTEEQAKVICEEFDLPADYFKPVEIEEVGV